MSLKFKSKSSNTNNAKFRPSDDRHPAIIAQIIDLGMHFKRDYKTQEIMIWPDGNPQINNEVFITFEFPTQQFEYEEGKKAPAWVSKRYTVSRNEKSSMYELLKACNSLNSDLTALAGSVVLVDVGSTSTGNAKIVGISAPKAKFFDEATETMINIADLKLSKGSCTIYDIDDGKNDVYASLPKFIQEIIDDQDSKEKYEAEKNKKGSAPLDDTPEDDIPY